MSKLKSERIDEARNYAASNGGECLSEVYLGAHKNLEWRCANRHEWSSTFINTVYSKSWCRVCCGKATLTLLEAQNYATERGGKCLSAIYVNNHTPLTWRCAKGHEWEAPLVTRSTSSWCPQCSYSQRGMARTLLHLDIADPLSHAAKLAAFYKGHCLSKTYKDAATKLEWKCSRGHRWFAPLRGVHNGRWCKRCRTIGRNEELVRQLLEHLTGKSFTKIRPKWLVSPRGFPLELDGYNEELQLAFEYQGVQHYRVDGQFGCENAKASLQRIQTHDAIKREQCAERGVMLLVVPYTVDRGEMESYLETLLSPALLVSTRGEFRFAVPSKPRKRRRN